MAAIRGFDCRPPAPATSGGRRLFKRRSEEAGVDTTDDLRDYLTLHGGRRGAGEMYYREAGHSAAQRALRHADPSTTSKSLKVFYEVIQLSLLLFQLLYMSYLFRQKMASKFGLVRWILQHLMAL